MEIKMCDGCEYIALSSIEGEYPCRKCEGLMKMIMEER